jgi:hypothetical protein
MHILNSPHLPPKLFPNIAYFPNEAKLGYPMREGQSYPLFGKSVPPFVRNAFHRLKIDQVEPYIGELANVRRLYSNQPVNSPELKQFHKIFMEHLKERVNFSATPILGEIGEKGVLSVS